MTTYALNNYTLCGSLCWANSLGHLSLVCTGSWGDRFVHLLIGLAEAVPIIGQIISLFEQFVVWCVTPPPPIPPIFPAGCPQPIRDVINRAPEFNSYAITLPNGRQTVLTNAQTRPANLFFDAMGITVTRPGEGLFAIRHRPEEVQRVLVDRARERDVVDVHARGYNAGIYGNNHYRISYTEVVQALISQEIFLSPLLALDFYDGLKDAMYRDGMVMVPNATLRQISQNNTHTGNFLKTVDPQLLDYTFYELATQVVKREDWRILMDHNGKLIARQEGANDAIRLLNLCGIRHMHPAPNQKNRLLMYNAFRASFTAAQSGIAIFPAIGMGVWGGDPELYWEALLDAYLDSPETVNFDALCVNPGHRYSPYGRYQGSTGREFLTILDRFKELHQRDPIKRAKLDKIIYLGTKDIVQLAHRLKLAFPDKTISLANASDPDVTLGFHVGEYVNNFGNPATTEENYTAMGTNGLAFELITGVHSRDQNRIHALHWN